MVNSKKRRNANRISKGEWVRRALKESVQPNRARSGGYGGVATGGA